MNLSWQFVCALFFGIACWGLGDLLFVRLYAHKSDVSRLARHTLSFASGNVAFSYLLTILGFSGLFIPSAFWAVFLSGVGLGIWRLRTVLCKPGVKGFSESWKKTRGNRFPAILLVATLGPFFLLSILQAAAPPYVRDSLVYHLLCPKEYLKASHLMHIPGNVFSAFPKGHEVLMTLLLSISGDRAAQSFGIIQQAAAICSLYSVARLQAGPWASVFCTFGYATIPPVIYFSGCGYVEPALLMALGGSLLALSHYIGSLPDAEGGGFLGLREIALIGFLSGWMPALKYNGLIYLGLIGFVLLWTQRKASLKEAARVIGMFTLGAIPGLCWMVWNWVTLGNPVYPMGWFLFGGKGWDEERALSMSLYFDLYGMGRNLPDYIKLPWRLAFSGKFDSTGFDGSIGPFLIIFLVLGLISLFLVVRHRSLRRDMGFLGLLLVVSASFFVFGTQQARFWLPSQLLLCAFAAPGLGILINWGRGNKWIRSVLGLIVTLPLLWNMWFVGQQVVSVGYYRPVFGLEQERTFLLRKVPGYPIIEYINRNLTDQDRVLCVWTGTYGYYFDRQYYSDTFIEDAELKGFMNGSPDGEMLAKRLLGDRFTHLYLGAPRLDKNLNPDQRLIFHQFLDKHTRLVAAFQSFWLLKIVDR